MKHGNSGDNLIRFPMPKTSTTWPSGSSWNHEQTKTIRVPVQFAETLLEVARALDKGHDVALISGNRTRRLTYTSGGFKRRLRDGDVDH